MSRRLLLSASALVLYVLGTLLTGCSSSNSNNQNHNQNHNPASITVTSGSSQSATVSTAFSSPLVATVADSGGNPVSGVSVTFTVVAGSGGASASFTTGGATDTETTGSNGQASTSQTLTANATTGTFTVTANFTGNAGSAATFNLTNTAVVVSTTTYVFYASGTELPNSYNCPSPCSTPSFYYALAGAVQINAAGTVVSGEEDYNDGFGITQLDLPITSGSLTVNATSGQGTLTLVTNNGTTTQEVGVDGTETLGVQFANTSHALIVQFDGTATSSGSLDLQTAAAGGGNYSFVLSGTDSSYEPVGYGGVYSVSSGAITGLADQNDAGTVSPGNSFTGTVGTADTFGRGQVTGVTINGTTLALVYYNVGAETIRLIDTDAGAAAIGSAYGQGSTAFTASSLGNSVVGLQSGAVAAGAFPYATAGNIITSATSGTNGGTFTGSVDADEDGHPLTDQAISGTYVVSTGSGNGYGNLTLTNSPFVYVSSLGVYTTDPALNLLDPNNTTGGGGALVLDLDPALAGGTGLVIPQTATTVSDFNGNYAFGAQEYFPSGGIIYEFDYLGEGSVTNLGLSGSGLVTDPFDYFGVVGYTPPVPVTMSGTATADPDESTNGRYTMIPFFVDAYTNSNSGVNSPNDDLSIAIYQANGGQLLFMEDSGASGSLGFGSFQQQGSLTGLPAKKNPLTRRNGR
jgi:hypothetical protein